MDGKTDDASGAGGGNMTEAEIDRNLAESFPASDPPSWTTGTDHRESPAPASDRPAANEES